jgi:phage-related protein
MGGTIKLTGESEYRKALKDITSNLKLVSSELKLTNAQFESGDKSVNDTRKAYDNMGNSLEEQKKNISNLRKELEKAETEFGSNNEKVIAFKTQLNKAETELKQMEKATKNSTDEVEDMGKELKETGQDVVKFGDLLKANIIGDFVVDGIKKLSGAIAGIGKEAIASFADYEQLVGGVETLFGSEYETVEEYAKGVGISMGKAERTFEQYQNRVQTVMDNANNAYKTAGMTANQYMETVTSFSASLNASLGENAWQSANYANTAITDMADNANKMGTAIESIQNAYQGFAKGNFTMLDNLKLGYGGTKEEMDRLMRDAEKLEGYIEGSLDKDNFANVIEAINIIQTNLGITGTTAKEASSTIAGSIATMKSAWSNLLSGMANKDADMGALTKNLTDSILQVVENLKPVIKVTMQSIAEVIKELLQEALPAETFEALTNGFQWIIDNSDLIISAIMGISTAFATLKIGGLVTKIGSAVSGMGGLAGALGALKAGAGGLVAGVGGPVTLIIAGVVALGTALVTLFKTNDEFRAKVIGAWETIKEVFTNVWGAIVSFFTETIPEAWGNVVTFFEGVPEWFAGVWQRVTDTFTLWGENIRIFFTETIPAIFTNFVTSVTTTLTAWGQSISNFFTVTIPAMWQALVDWFNSLPEKIGFALGYVIGTIVKWGSNVLEYLVTNVPIWIDNVVKFFSELPEKINKWLKETGEKISNWGKSVKEKAIETGTAFIESIVKFFTEVPKKIGEKIGEALEKVKAWGTNMKNKAIEIGTAFIESIVKFFTELPSKISNWFTATITKVVNFGTDLWNKGKEAGKKLVDSIVETVSSIPEKMAEIGSNIVEGIWNGISNMGDWIWDKISGFCSGVVDGVKSALGIHSPSRIMKDEVGKNMALGIGEGFTGMMKNVNREMANAIQTDYDLSVGSNLSSGQASTESYYANMVDAFKEALKEVKVVMDDREMGTFVTDTMERVVYA